METGTANNKGKRVAALVIMVLVVLLFIWAIVLLLLPVAEEPNSTLPEPVPSVPAETPETSLPQTGVSHE